MSPRTEARPTHGTPPACTAADGWWTCTSRASNGHTYQTRVPAFAGAGGSWAIGSWVPFYEELANRLLPFRNDRTELVAYVRGVYDQTGIKVPTLQAKGSELFDIDPFTVFGLFNKGITNENRLKIAGALKELLDVRAALPDEFDGVPVLNNQGAAFYKFEGDPKGRPDEIDDLWNLFATALAYADAPGDMARTDLVVAFDRARNIKGNNRKLAMGLFWARPRTYLTLDKRTTWFIKDCSDLPVGLAHEIGSRGMIPEGKVYLGWCDAVRAELKGGGHPYRDFVELSAAAWLVSEDVNDQMATEKESTGKAAAQLSDAQGSTARWWLYSAGEDGSTWDECLEGSIMSVGWTDHGDMGRFDSEAEILLYLQEQQEDGRRPTNDAKLLWEFSHVMAPGDVVVAKRGIHTILGRGIVRSDYRYVPEREHYVQVRDVEWTHAGEWDWTQDTKQNLPRKALTDITNKRKYREILPGYFTDGHLISRSKGKPDESTPADPTAVASSPAPTPELISTAPPYTHADFLREVYVNADALDTLEYLVRRKKNVVLEGAPGTGKTFCARRLAWELMGEKDDNRIVALQFHQSYAYEDFVEGWRPTEAGFELRHGAFYELCRRAETDPGRAYFLLIDEVNRANLGKVLGELFGLLKADKRGEEVRLLYSGEAFSVPENLYVIGTMNTADRSLALIDYALRRRFAFFRMEPAFESPQFRAYAAGLESPTLNALVAAVHELNEVIASDDALGPGFAIGHSYLCNVTPGEATAKNLRRIVDFELAPLLREYWFDEPETAEEWVGRLEAALR